LLCAPVRGFVPWLTGGAGFIPGVGKQSGQANAEARKAPRRMHLTGSVNDRAAVGRSVCRGPRGGCGQRCGWPRLSVSAPGSGGGAWPPVVHHSPCAGRSQRPGSAVHGRLTAVFFLRRSVMGMPVVAAGVPDGRVSAAGDRGPPGGGRPWAGTETGLNAFITLAGPSPGWSRAGCSRELMRRRISPMAGAGVISRRCPSATAT